METTTDLTWKIIFYVALAALVVVLLMKKKKQVKDSIDIDENNKPKNKDKNES